MLAVFCLSYDVCNAFYRRYFPPSFVTSSRAGKVNDGQIDVDQAALTGESLPVTMGARSEPKMGSTVTRGVRERVSDRSSTLIDFWLVFSFRWSHQNVVATILPD